MCRLSPARTVRSLAVLPALAALLFLLPGCDEESYPAGLHYPMRSDPIVTKAPSDTPFDPPTPGQLDASIAKITSLGGQTLDPKAFPANYQADLKQALEERFGTPAAPHVGTDQDSQEAKDAVAKLKLDPHTLARGSQVYRRHCLHCHGLTGDGRGPTGPWLNPFPRDYRQGSFKFISTDNGITGRKPRREDLMRTLREGIDGTSMPSFNVLPGDDLEALVSYVIHLSIRGEVELETLKPVIAAKGDISDLEADNIKGHVEAVFNRLLTERWLASNKSNEPPAYPYDDKNDKQLKESITRGFMLFTDTKGAASCIGCHYDYGRQVPFRYDEWGTLVRPSNLTAGVYRGGRRPIDIYWRIKGGIPPSQMPGAELNQGKGRKPGTDDYWDLVNFVKALPYPAMLPEDVRKEVYGARREAPASHETIKGHE